MDCPATRFSDLYNDDCMENLNMQFYQGDSWSFLLYHKKIFVYSVDLSFSSEICQNSKSPYWLVNYSRMWWSTKFGIIQSKNDKHHHTMQPLFWYQTAEGNIKKIFVSRIQHRYLLILCTHVIHDKYLQLGIFLMESVSSKQLHRYRTKSATL